LEPACLVGAEIGGGSFGGRVHFNDHPARLALLQEPELTSPRERAEGSIGVNPQRVAPHRERLRGRAVASLDAGARPDAAEPRDEPRVLRVEVLEDNELIGLDRVNLLIVGGHVKERRIKALRQRLGREERRRPRARARVKLRSPGRPRGRDRPEAYRRGNAGVGRCGRVQRLQARERRIAMTSGSRNADRVLWPGRGVLVAEGDLGRHRSFVDLSIGGHVARPEDLD
jgi:hypothetical protein